MVAKKRLSAEELEIRFQRLKRVELALELSVKGYNGVAINFDTYKEYAAAHRGKDGKISAVENARVSQTVDMRRKMMQFKQKFGYDPDIDLRTIVDWSAQIDVQEKMAKQDCRVSIIADSTDGQLVMDRPSQGGFYEFISFDIEFDELGNGKFVLEEGAQQRLPLLQEFFSGIKIKDGRMGGVSLEDSSLDHLNISNCWLYGQMDAKQIDEEVFVEVSKDLSRMVPQKAVSGKVIEMEDDNQYAP